MQIQRFSPDLSFDLSRSMYPSFLSCHVSGETLLDDVASTYYGIVTQGSVQLKREGLPNLSCSKDMYFSAPGPLSIGGDGHAVIIRRFGYRGLFHMGGPTEARGRLTYIDNCTTTLLVPPARLGDPVLNLLVFPPEIRQTNHIHPTVRLGVVLSGGGHCVRPNQQPLPLEAGMAFLIDENEQHCFHSGKEGMSVIAYHPDSEWGPEDESHPMLNRTYQKPVP